ncbi:antitoxin Xre-like helix-turn-helix domain-containing protein [Shewanella sp. HL-SH5]|uniref:antitoxin Xre-like helix-turn-helix domain-containing protein n=1 Tax=unclassified Shewanella TaxID=196818 RepID=UPI003EBDECF7
MTAHNTNTSNIDFAEAKTSKVGFSAAVSILEKWGCAPKDMLNILRLPRSSYFAFKKPEAKFVLDKDQLTRISYILNIHAALRMYFSNPENVYGFMQMENANPYFEGRKPLDIIKGGGFPELHEVFSRVDSMRSGGW